MLARLSGFVQPSTCEYFVLRLVYHPIGSPADTAAAGAVVETGGTRSKMHNLKQSAPD